MRRKSFFNHLGYILLYGILGTLITFFVIGLFTSIFNYLGVFIANGRILELTIKEILLFSCVISATDTLAAFTFIKEEEEPKLFSLLFGEGIINDAVSIVLFKIITNFNSSNTG